MLSRHVVSRKFAFIRKIAYPNLHDSYFPAHDGGQYLFTDFYSGHFTPPYSHSYETLFGFVILHAYKNYEFIQTNLTKGSCLNLRKNGNTV